MFIARYKNLTQFLKRTLRFVSNSSTFLLQLTWVSIIDNFVQFCNYQNAFIHFIKFIIVILSLKKVFFKRKTTLTEKKLFMFIPLQIINSFFFSVCVKKKNVERRKRIA